MFKIQSEVLKGVVSSLAKGARKAKLGERFIFVRTEDEKVSFYFVGDDTSVEKKRLNSLMQDTTPLNQLLS